MAEAGLYRIAAPARCGGSDVDPMTQLATIEAVANADGSTGWNLMIGIESFGLIAPAFEQCADLLADPLTILCGSTAAVCQADETPNGYRVNGRWQFVSGSNNSQVFAGLVQRRRNGKAIEGLPPVYAVVTRPDFVVLDTWNVGGLCGSGSHDVTITDVEVPNERILAQMGRHHDRSPLEHFPLGSRLAYNKVGVALGIGRAAIDAFVDIATGKVPRFTSTHACATGRLRNAPSPEPKFACAPGARWYSNCSKRCGRKSALPKRSHRTTARCSRSRAPMRLQAAPKRSTPWPKRPAPPPTTAPGRWNGSRATFA